MANEQKPKVDEDFHEETPEEFAAGKDERHFSNVPAAGSDASTDTDSDTDRDVEGDDEHPEPEASGRS